MAERPRTGVTTSTTSTAHASRLAAAAAQAPALAFHSVGRAPRATRASCHPVSPKKCPIRALE